MSGGKGRGLSVGASPTKTTGKNRSVPTSSTVNNKQKKATKPKSEDNATKPVIDDDETWICVVCDDKFEGSIGDVIECEMCFKHFCISCVEVSQEHYRLLNECTSAHWYCPTCEEKAVKTVKAEFVVEERCKAFIEKMEEKMEARITYLEAELEKKMSEEDVKELVEKTITHTAEERIKEIVENKLAEKEAASAHASQENVKELVEKTITDSAEETIKEIVENKLAENDAAASAHVAEEKVKVVVSSMIDKHSTDQQDKDGRKLNALIYHVSESDKEEPERRKEDDLKFIADLKVELGVEESEISNIVRLGKRSDDITKPRPMKVMFDSEKSKKGFMCKLGNLANAQDNFKKISVSHDMTKEEREQNKKKVQEAKNLNREHPSEEWVYRVRGLPGMKKVMRVKKNN